MTLRFIFFDRPLFRPAAAQNPNSQPPHWSIVFSNGNIIGRKRIANRSNPTSRWGMFWSLFIENWDLFEI